MYTSSSKNKLTVLKEHDYCPACLSGKLYKRSGISGEFLGCSNYPRCGFIAKYFIFPKKDPKSLHKC